MDELNISVITIYLYLSLSSYLSVLYIYECSKYMSAQISQLQDERNIQVYAIMTMCPLPSPQWRCGNSCTWAHDVRLHIQHHIQITRQSSYTRQRQFFLSLINHNSSIIFFMFLIILWWNTISNQPKQVLKLWSAKSISHLHI